MRAWQLAARESIRDLVARYNATGDSGRFGETLALFAQDAVLEIVPDHCYRGRDEIHELFTRAAATARAHDGDRDQSRDGHESEIRLLRHFTATHQIDLVGRAEASGRCYYAVLTERGLDHWGRYLDHYHCSRGRWRFSLRKVFIDGSVPGSWAERTTERLRGSGSSRPNAEKKPTRTNSR